MKGGPQLMINGSYCLRNEEALSSEAPDPKHPVPPPRDQSMELLKQGVGWVGQDGGGLSDHVSVVQS